MPADAGCAAGSKPCAGLHALPGTSGRACAGPSTAGQTPAWVTKNIQEHNCPVIVRAFKINFGVQIRKIQK